MEKLQKFSPLVLLCLYSLKTMILGSQLSDSLILIALASLSAFFIYKEKDKQYQDLKIEIEQIRKEFKKSTEDFENLRTKLNAVQVSSGIKQVTRG